MILIAHRGNIAGPDPTRENTETYLGEALEAGFHVEVDVWDVVDDGGPSALLGHDQVLDAVHPGLLRNEHVWCHCKTLKALEYLMRIGCRCFVHDTDLGTFTSDGFFWTADASNEYQLDRTVLMHAGDLLASENAWQIQRVVGVCSDYVENYCHHV